MTLLFIVIGGVLLLSMWEFILSFALLGVGIACMIMFIKWVLALGGIY